MKTLRRTVSQFELGESRRGWVAARAGLPAIGSTMVNKHGIEWVVIDHSPLPTVETISRWNRGALVPSDDLYPVVKPLNLSPKLTEFLETIDRCTTKSFAVVDTMPGRRKDGHTPGANHIDTLCHPETNIIYLDVARVSEAVIAHELGHAWLQYVEQCEDLRTSSYDVEPARARMVSYVQSYVLDLRVNALLREKGFDLAVIEQDQATSLAQLSTAIYAGYEPDSAREEVFMALLLADAKVRMSTQGAALVRESRAEIAIREARPRLDMLAATFAEAAARNGHDSAQAVEQAVNECLLAAFAFTGEDFDPNVDLVKVDPPEPDRDKFPKWLPGFLPRAKCEVGRHMALNGVTSEWHGQVEVTRALTARVTFTSPDHTQRSEVVVDHAIRTPIRFDGIPEQLAEMLELQKKNAEQRLRRLSPTVPQPPSPPAFQGRPQPGFGTGQMRRNYMAGTGRFLTAARMAERIAGEHPYGYAFDNPVTYTDPSGNSPSMTISDCPAPVEAWLKKMCSNLGNISNRRLERINSCIDRNSRYGGSKCSGISAGQLSCMKDYCKRGDVKCFPGLTPSGDAGYCWGTSYVDWFWGRHPPIDISIGVAGTNRYDNLFEDIVTGGGTNLKNVGLIFLHELGHACGVSHGDRPNNWQCNDVISWCIYGSFW